MSASDPIVIAGASRTPMGGFQGELSALTASELGGAAIRAALEGAGVAAGKVDEVLMGNVLPAGQGQAPARQAAFHAGLGEEVPCSTLNKMCGSGMKTTMIAFDQLLAGNGSVIVAGGMESMTNAPYLLDKMRGGARLGHAEVKDHMFLDGLEDAYDKGRLMGTFAEDCAEKYQFTRDEQDAYAIRSLEGALKAEREGWFRNEIVPVTVSSRKGEEVFSSDEQPRKARPEKIPQLKPAFRKEGTVTAANSSSISDGAAALVLMRQSEAERNGYTVRARILGHASHAQAPGWFTTAPVFAMNKLMERIGRGIHNDQLFDINEE
jgi:acetyl-CoA C-acetyltransferase